MVEAPFFLHEETCARGEPVVAVGETLQARHAVNRGRRRAPKEEAPGAQPRLHHRPQSAAYDAIVDAETEVPGLPTTIGQPRIALKTERAVRCLLRLLLELRRLGKFDDELA